MAAAVLRSPSPCQIREELQAAVARDLLGPAGGSEEEVDENRVIDRYLVVTAPGGAAVFRKRVQPHDPARVDVEDRAMATIYREHVEFAVGHGVSVHADLDPGSTDRAVRVSTR